MICRPATLEDQLSNVHPADLREPVWCELDEYPPDGHGFFLAVLFCCAVVGGVVLVFLL